MLGLLVGLGAIAAGSTLVAGGAVVTGGTGGAGVVVGAPAAGGGFALLGVGGALIGAAAEEIARDAADGLPARPEAAPEARRAGVRESVLNPDGTLPGEPGKSPRVWVVDEHEAGQIEGSVRDRLGPPDRVIDSPGKGRVEIWDIAPDEAVVIRQFSTSGRPGRPGDRTIDIKVQGLEGVRKIHVKP